MMNTSSLENIQNRALSTNTGFSERSQQLAMAETAATAVAAQAKAMVEARYIMALQRPRDWDQVRQDLIKECRRPSFANNKSAFYVKPIGNGVEGLGIRFVEVGLRCMRNVLIESTVIFEDDLKEVHRVSVTDLESNITYPTDVKVTKTVERSKPSDDGSYFSVRLNSYNKKVFTVAANDDDLLNKRGALISKAIRTLGLRIIPGDLQDEAERIIKAVRNDEAARDPEAAKKAIIDAFAEINVSVTDLVEYLGHDIARCSPQQLVELRGIYGAIRDGEATWVSVMENAENHKQKTPEKKPTAGPTPAPTQAPTARPTQAPAEPAKSSRLSPEEIAAIQAQEQDELVDQQQPEDQPEQRTTRARSERKPMNLE